jgi:hypothetical protein
MINWKWPHTKQNNLLPWYLMLKNMCAIPFYIIGGIFIFIGYLIVYGPKRANYDFPDLRLF